MELNISKMGDVCTITLTGRIDASIALDIEQELLLLISEGSCKLVTTLSEVTFISSAGLRSLIAVLKQAKREGGDLRLAEMDRRVQEVFDITGISTIFKIFPSSKDAVQSFGD
jgi:anti-anti-sigma factor